MSGQQIGSGVGQVVGGIIGSVIPYVGTTLGAVIGGALGGAIGGSFDPDIVKEGPRLLDLRIQTSSYGNAVPIIYGTFRCAGNVIWSTDIRETVIETEEGKGGPAVIQREYNYDMDVAIAVGEGLIDGIERMYANGVLIYDATSAAVPASVFASGQWATGMYFYTGSEAQLPDPTMEAALGVGNVPAYRGTAYLVITGLQLNVLKTGALPNFEFVVVTDGTLQLGRQVRQVSGLTPVYHSNSAPYVDPTPIVANLNVTVRVANSDDSVVRIYDLNGVELGFEQRTWKEEAIPDYSTGSAPFGVWVTFNRKATTSVLNLQIGSGAVFTVDTVNMLSVVASTDYLRGIVACVDQRNYLLLTSTGANNISAWYRVEWNGTAPLLRASGSVNTTGLSLNEANDWGRAPVYQASAAHYVAMMESDLIHLWQVDHGNVAVWEISKGGVTGGVMSRVIYFNSGSLPLRNMVAAGSALAPAINANKGLAAIVCGNNAGTTSYFFLYSRLESVTSTAIPLTTILTDICDRAALDVGELTFTGISDTVDGFAIGQTMSARAAIEVLRTAYYFDAVDSDTFKFVKRGATSVVDIAYADLGAGSEQPATVATAVTRAQETELPSRVNVKYLSASADFQIAAQSARRETTGSRETAEVQLPIVFLDDDDAAQIADILLRERWAGAMQRSFSTTIEYAKYEPTDVVTVDDGFAVRTVRVTRKVDKGSLIDWEAVDEDIAAYDSNAIGVPIEVPEQEMAVQGPSAFEVLDLPPLTTLADGNESAAYVAGKGYFASWPGVVLEVSRNDGTTYEGASTVTQASVMGAALTTLANFTGGNVFDESSIVRVAVGAGTLSSLTHLEVLNGGNPCVIGDEILQFRTASLVSTGVYDLSGLLRGRKGTERFISTHAIGDRFVLLTTKLRNIPLQLNDRLLESLLVRGTTGGALPSDGVVKSFEPEIARLMPYAPTHLSGTRDAANDWTLTWVRRDRYMNDWNSGADVPLSETYELYDVEVLVSSVVVETYVDVATTSQIVPAAVYGPPYTSITFRVYQKSSVLGRGFAATATITQA